jgi:tetratricopeptide (TPR) repeat protein
MRKLVVGLVAVPLLLVGAGTRADAPPARASAPRLAPQLTRDAQAVVATNPQQQIALGFQKHEAGDYAEAASLFLEAAGQFPVARAFAARSLMEEGQIHEAYSQAVQAVQAVGCTPLTHFMLALVSERSGRADEAKSQYQQVLEMDPHSAAAYNNLGGLAYLREDFYTARTDTERALSLVAADPHGRAIALANLAELDELGGDLVAAEDKLNQALEAAPEDAPPYYSLAVLYDVTGRADAAASMEKDALELDPHGAVWRATSYVWPELQLHAEALAAESRGDAAAAVQRWNALHAIDSAGALHWSALKGVAAAHLARLVVPTATTEVAPLRQGLTTGLAETPEAALRGEPAEGDAATR